ncbi:CLCA_X family protein [Aliiglaciecola sp. LCG003]|uniref:CLCA_X family protein n=1 Tax=Aliiglaciecola sp. LCG003 TaxID=3053655 RepID=UPI002573749C|nr:CLCA_X family protein [Aliiglaciecola sp. LCG003]WJG08972.1 hypothetical protein QR722_16820 [Aliiglaciecola sp. LCG003]
MPEPIPRIQRPFYRNGSEHRSGADVSFADINKMFGFKRVSVGKWVTKEEQQIAANLFFDAFCDLMDILHVPEQVISLNGTLSLAFGVGGQKHSSAHYEVQTRQLCLAKNAGGGALAHEWFHAFDHYICPKMFINTSRLSFASQLWLEDDQQYSHPLNERLADWFEHLYLNEQGNEPSEYVRLSSLADKSMQFFYYAQPQEMAARAFEATIQDHPIKNAFLVQGTKLSPEAKLGIYPLGTHRTMGNQLILRYFDILGRVLAPQ